MRTDANRIYSEYMRGVSYNTQMQLYETVRQNENFYIGKQWEGLNAPDLPKPVINVLKRVVSYFISMIVADDVGVSFEPFSGTGISDASAWREGVIGEADEMQLAAKVTATEVEKVMEFTKIKSKTRDVIRNAAVDGDGCLYFWFDTQAAGAGEVRGAIACDIIESTGLIFSNPYTNDLQRQRYIIVEMRKQVESVREEARRAGLGESEINAIVPEGDSNQYDATNSTPDDLVTVLVKMWKQNGSVRCVRCTRDVVLKDEWDTGLSLYPVAVMPWERVKNSCRGQSALTGLIPNQISINQLFAMGIYSVKMNAFPRVFYDMTKISSWSNRVGQAVGVAGNPNEAVAASFNGADMSAQVMQLIESLIQKTLEFMGASDASLGNIKPDNTSAIIATQKASAMPLELQKMTFLAFSEDYVRIIADMIHAYYGVRYVEAEYNGALYSGMYDFSVRDVSGFNMRVDVGTAAYWSEIMQLQTLDNLFTKGVITDAVTYLESIPETYLRGKTKIIQSIKDSSENVQAQPETLA